MTKTQFLRTHLNNATQKGAYNMETARALANCLDQIENDMDALQKFQYGMGAELKPGNTGMEDLSSVEKPKKADK